MHIYIYDAFVNQKKYEHTVARIETRITDLGLNGKIVRLGAMRNTCDIIASELKRGAKTIIIVGNNQTINMAINAMVAPSSSTPLNCSIPIGIIPIGKSNNEIAASLGIDLEEEACDTLSARRIEVLDLGMANRHVFLSEATIINTGTTLEIDQSYSIEIMKPGEIKVVNLSINPMELPKNASPNPQDRNLELYVRTTSGKKFLRLSIPAASIFSFKKLTINNKNHPFILDHSVKIATPVEIQLALQKLPVIIGKERNF